jgi:hypothetical protein
VTGNDHYREAEVLVQPTDPEGEQGIPEADVQAAQVHAMLAVPDQLADAVEVLRNLVRVQGERARFAAN